nr:flagellin [Bacilli bacterium]
MAMNFSINNNAAASGILSNLNYVQNQINTSYAQLSSGNRINSAADDPAGYAISQQMQSQVNGLNAATQNSQNGVSLIQTATGAMGQVMSILQTMNTLAVEAANGTQNTADLNNLQSEWTSLTSQITTINNNTQFNTIALFGGGTGSSIAMTLQVGATNGQVLTFSINSISAGALNVGSGVGISTMTAASSAISAVAAAISTLSTYQADLGAVQNQLNYTISNLQNSSMNLQNAEATITNTNMAQAYTTFSQNQILNQVGDAMLSQAQQQPGAILKLLQ